MTFSRLPAVCAAKLLALGLAACAATPAPQQTQILEPSGPPAVELEEESFVAEIAPAKKIAPPPPRPTRKPAWIKRIDPRIATNARGKSNASVSSIQPLYQGEDKEETLFTQVRIDHNRQDGVTDTSNLGLGYRHLLARDFLVGVNGFYDREWAEAIERAGASTEIRWKSFDMSLNYYGGLSDADAESSTLDGYNLEIGSQLPYLPWAQAKFASTDFFSDEGSVSNSYSAAMKLDLLRYLRLDLGMYGTADDIQSGMVRLNFMLKPGLGGAGRYYALGPTPVSDNFFESRDLRPHTLDRVRRIGAILTDG